MKSILLEKSISVTPVEHNAQGNPLLPVKGVSSEQLQVCVGCGVAQCHKSSHGRMRFRLEHCV